MQQAAPLTQLMQAPRQGTACQSLLALKPLSDLIIMHLRYTQLSALLEHPPSRSMLQLRVAFVSSMAWVSTQPFLQSCLNNGPC